MCEQFFFFTQNDTDTFRFFFMLENIPSQNILKIHFF